jgi:hypothetical protein
MPLASSIASIKYIDPLNYATSFKILAYETYITLAWIFGVFSLTLLCLFLKIMQKAGIYKVINVLLMINLKILYLPIISIR